MYDVCTSLETARCFARSNWKRFRRRQHFKGQLFRAGLERPLYRQVMPERIEVRGYAVALGQSTVIGRVVVNDQFTTQLVIDQKRVDVASRFALAEDEQEVGFSRVIEWDDLERGIEQASVTIELSCENQILVLGPLQVFRRNREPISEEGIRVCVELPQPNSAVAERLDIRGWVAAPDNDAVNAYVVIENNEPIPLELTEPREDVERELLLKHWRCPLGFVKQVLWQDIAPDLDRITLRFDFEYHGAVIVVGPIPVYKTSSPQVLHLRGNYKEVWDTQAENETLAMEAVAAIPDRDSFFKSGMSSAETLRTLLEISPQDTVLEIGCGAGRIGASLAPHCRRWIGSDISSKMLGYAAQNLANQTNVEFVELTGCNLSMIEEGSIDKAYCCTVFMHLDEWDRYRYVSEIFRSLRPGGKAYVDNINLEGDIGWEIFEELTQLDSASRLPMISKTSTTQELNTFMTRAGFIEIEMLPGAHLVAATGIKPQ